MKDLGDLMTEQETSKEDVQVEKNEERPESHLELTEMVEMALAMDKWQYTDGGNYYQSYEGRKGNYVVKYTDWIESTGYENTLTIGEVKGKGENQKWIKLGSQTGKGEGFEKLLEYIKDMVQETSVKEVTPHLKKAREFLKKPPTKRKVKAQEELSMEEMVKLFEQGTDWYFHSGYDRWDESFYRCTVGDIQLKLEQLDWSDSITYRIRADSIPKKEGEKVRSLGYHSGDEKVLVEMYHTKVPEMRNQDGTRIKNPLLRKARKTLNTKVEETGEKVDPLSRKELIKLVKNTRNWHKRDNSDLKGEYEGITLTFYRHSFDVEEGANFYIQAIMKDESGKETEVGLIDSKDKGDGLEKLHQETIPSKIEEYRLEQLTPYLSTVREIIGQEPAKYNKKAELQEELSLEELVAIGLKLDSWTEDSQYNSLKAYNADIEKDLKLAIYRTTKKKKLPKKKLQKQKFKETHNYVIYFSSPKGNLGRYEGSSPLAKTLHDNIPHLMQANKLKEMQPYLKKVRKQLLN